MPSSPTTRPRFWPPSARMAESSRPTLAQELAAARRQLEASSPSPALDVRLLASAAFGLDAAGLLLRGGEPADEEGLARLRQTIGQREAGRPVHRILGRRSFYAHDFELSPDTLEPRPDTEIVVELAARTLHERGRADAVMADLGTGSGAIAVSLLALFPQALCVAVDLSQGALATARRNAEAAGVGSRFLPVVGDYLAAVGGPLDLVVSNPPYIRTGDIATLSRDVRSHDPILALDGGADGLDAYRAIASGVAMRSTWDVVLEIGAGQRDEVAAIFANAGYGLVETADDLAGHVRALRLCRKDR